MAIKKKYNSNKPPARERKAAPTPPPAPPAPEPDVDSLGMRILQTSAKYALTFGTAGAVETSRELLGEKLTMVGSGLLTAAAIITEVAAPQSSVNAVLSPVGQATAATGLAIPITRKILHATGIAKPKNELSPEEMRRQIRLFRSGDPLPLPAPSGHDAETYETVYQGAQQRS